MFCQWDNLRKRLHKLDLIKTICITFTTHQLIFLWLRFYTLTNAESIRHSVYLWTLNNNLLTPYHEKKSFFGGVSSKKKIQKIILGDGWLKYLFHARKIAQLYSKFSAIKSIKIWINNILATRNEKNLFHYIKKGKAKIVFIY